MKSIGNIVIVGVLIITGVIVCAVVIGALFGRQVDADTRAIVLMFVGALLALFGGVKIGEAGSEQKATDAYFLGRTTRENEYRLAMQQSKPSTSQYGSFDYTKP